MPDPTPLSTPAAFLSGLRAGLTSIFALVLIGTYVGPGALAHDVGFSLAWTLAATLLLWAGPAQVILTAALGSGAGLVETGVAVGLSSVRLLPMVVALLGVRGVTWLRTARCGGPERRCAGHP
jgi:predicted branched-subunit amino acid permease